MRKTRSEPSLHGREGHGNRELREDNAGLGFLGTEPANAGSHKAPVQPHWDALLASTAEEVTRELPDGTTHAALEDPTEHQMENESRKVLSNIMELGNSSINGSKSGTTRAGGLALSASMKWVPLSNLHVDVPKDVTRPTITTSDEPDTLYKRLSILVKAHDRAVLDSYEYFAVLAAKELGISIKVHEPPRKIERFTLLKSVHIFKKHRVQYEMRTLYRCLELKHLTGSTASVYLEYIQRNLPEGVAMEVTKTQIQQLPEHIKEPMWETVPEEKKESKS